MSEPTKTTRQIRAEKFAQEPFWVKDFRPTMQAMIADRMMALRDCPLGEVKAIRAKIDILEALIDYPQTTIKAEIDNTDFENAQREFDDDTTAAQRHDGQ